MSEGDRWPLVRDLFERALAQPPEEVGHWLKREGFGDGDLRSEVLSLVQHHARAGSFLVEPAADRLPDLMADNRPLEPGQIVGPYTIVREVGRGGMGRVYLATDGRLGRRVALKALSPELTVDPAHRHRLRREARAAAALTHPGICTIYALDEFDGELYIAAEFVDGRTLREEVGGVRPPVAGVVRTARELAAALADAHDHGITHRDLKPENVMRTADGRLKILDFGLARIDAPPTATPEPSDAQETQPVEGHVTQPGTLVGTPAYMAPEQLNGQPVGPRADVFAYGVLLYEYACGSHPFVAATSLGMAARILETDAMPIDRRRPDLPAAFVDVIRRCLSKAPADRFASATEIVLALERTDAARPPGRIATWWRAHQIAVVASYFIACGLTWQIKEWEPGITVPIFIVAGIAATVGGVLRGHLLFTERVTGASLAVGRRTAPITLAVDALMAVALAVDGILLAPRRPLAAVLTIALGVGIAVARLIVEPTTTAATFKHPLENSTAEAQLR